ncbi:MULTISPECIES: helix-turn-helix domain-containing protein [Halomonadaceae]|uniref:helix-turn-helix domain-containing protein n=1 Tax=Halomonadaceae TaxID=28256 RepID=UPI001583AA5D|nr:MULTISPECIES: helix-turn-helix domain-containing protein [Halomonas]MDI4637510.1 helix-turn-helix domain-containing protein [Halomonas sp. BMC7]NUJ61344.1 helix-turn-helix domain-containing protein [Halomonas taeanensis]
MTKTVQYSSALMGSGKTQQFVDQLDGLRNIIYAAPTIDLGEGVLTRIQDEFEEHGHYSECINSRDYHKESVKARIERALTEGREGCVLIVTQKSLLNINPEYLVGWEVVIDEVPNVLDNVYKSVGVNTYKRFFDGLLDDGMEELTGNCQIEPSAEMVAYDLYADSFRNEDNTYQIVLGGLLSETAIVKKEMSEDGKVMFLVHDHENWKPIIEFANEFHVMGNAIEKSLFNLYIKACGFKTKRSKYTPDFSGYKMSPTIVPLVKGNKFSKAMMMNGDDKWSPNCWGYKIIDKALSYHENNPVMIQHFSWMYHKDLEKKHPNAEWTKFDLRGSNNYDKYHRTVNVLHGNPEPIIARMNIFMLKHLGIDVDKGQEAIRYFRYIEQICQYILRTEMRQLEGQTTATVAVVPTVQTARDIEKALQIECDIDMSIVQDPPKSKAAAKREDLKAKAKELSDKGWTYQKIADEIGKNKGTISRWLKEVS